MLFFENIFINLLKEIEKIVLTNVSTSIRLLVYPVNGRVFGAVHQRAGTEWKASGNVFEEAHPGGSFLKSVGKDGSRRYGKRG